MSGDGVVDGVELAEFSDVVLLEVAVLSDIDGVGLRIFEILFGAKRFIVNRAIGRCTDIVLFVANTAIFGVDLGRSGPYGDITLPGGMCI